MKMLLQTGPIALAILMHSQSVTADDLGKYVCTVENVQGEEWIGSTWKGAILFYDADQGVLDVSLYMYETRWEKTRMFSRLNVVTRPSEYHHLHAVQFDPPEHEYFESPIVAWLMIEAGHDRDRPQFTFFSTPLRSVAVGSCERE